MYRQPSMSKGSRSVVSTESGKQALKIKEQSTRVGVLGKLTNDLFVAVKDVSQVLKFISVISKGQIQAAI